MSQNHDAKVLIYDIETWPATVLTWGAYDQNVLKVVEEWGILCFAYKWLGEDEIHFERAKYLKTWKRLSDSHVTLRLHQLLDEADIAVAHNGDRFDHKKANAQFLKYGLGPVSPYQSIDTKKASSRYFGQIKNNLDYLGERLGFGQKLKHQGIDLWISCMQGDDEAFEVMEAYNRRDVELLEQVYLELRPWMYDSHPNMAHYAPDFHLRCKYCASTNVQRRGYHDTKVSRFQRYKCNNCGGYSRVRVRESQAGGKGVKLT